MASSIDPDASALSIRPFTRSEDYAACAALQRETWGKEFAEVVPPGVLMVTQKMGGTATGAFDSTGALVAFVYGMTGWRDGRLAHWSHMLAVTSAWRDRGVGTRLKHHQRRQLLELGVDVMYWTYDPLVARNAHVNLARLGATVVEYVQDQYGPDEGNTVDSVIGTDRFVVEWRLRRDPPVAQDPFDAADDVAVVERVSGQTGAYAVRVGDFSSFPSVRIDIPPLIHELKVHDPEAALAWRLATREAFTWYLDRGYGVVGFLAERAAQRPFYRLERSERSP